MVSSSPGSPQIPSLKRARSNTVESGTVSPKRTNSVVDDVGQDVVDAGMTPAADAGIDEYMQLQDEEADIGLASIVTLDEGENKGLTGAEQYQMISNLSKMPLELGATWYVVAGKWLTAWQAATGIAPSKDHPNITIRTLGPVDNSSILHPGTGEMLVDLELGEDYEVLPDAAWDKFVEWYGKPQIVLPRNVVSFSGETRVEVYPPVFRVYQIVPDNSSPVVPWSRVDISSFNHLSVLAARAATALRLHTDAGYRVWNMPASIPISNGIHASDVQPGTLVPIPADSKTPLSDFVKLSDILAVEIKSSTGEWVLDSDTVAVPTESSADESLAPLFNTGSDYLSVLEKNNKVKAVTAPAPESTTSRLKNTLTNLTFRGKSPAPPVQRGTMGLQNLGNTCFMNSALQCLAHIPELEQYFLSGLYRHELNFDNPLGMQGQIANVFGALLHNLYPAPGQQIATRSTGWGSSSSSYAPREFKQTIGRFAPAFSGYQQHDTQEFLGFLLDGLHEDLNRVLKKPYVEKPEWPEEGGDRDMEVKIARDTWDGYKRRNDSIIVDLFQGMYKSTLVCPECAKVSITFDPFMYLTLPLPVTKTWRHTVHYVPWDPNKPLLAVEIEVPKDSSYGYLKKLFGRWFSVEPDNLLVAEVWAHKFYKFYEDYMNLTELADKDVLVVYELPMPFKSFAKPPPPTSFMFGGRANFGSGRSTPNPNPNPTAPLLIPVFHTSVGAGFRNGSFGVPFFVALDPSVAGSRESIYRAVVERSQRWTRNRSDLWRYRGYKNATPSADDELEEVVASIAPDLTQTGAEGSVTEIRPEGGEAGEEMKVEVVADVEMSVAETPRDDDSGVVVDREDAEDPFEIVAPQEGLFDLKLYSSPTTTGIETGFNMNPSSARFVDWATREQAGPGSDVESEDGGSGILVQPPASAPPLLKPTDALVCVWPPTMLNHFFSPEESLFEHWDPYIHPEVQELRAAQIKSRSGKRSIDIEDCLNEFTKEEQLGEDDLWYCPRCKKHQQATKKFELWSVPDILVVHLKRFSNARAMRDKIDALVEFPIEGLDLGKRVGEGDPTECVYDLFAVDEHMGGLGGGHYRAYAKNPADEAWYHFDDSYVSKSSAEDSVNANAYLLFYRRRSASPTAAVEKVKARIGPVQDTPTSSKTVIDMSAEPVVRGSTLDTALPTFEESGNDPVVQPVFHPSFDPSEYNTMPSGYDNALPGAYVDDSTMYSNPGPYRSTTGGSDDEPPFTNTTSPASSGGSVGVAYDSAEDKDLDDDFPDTNPIVGGGVKVEVTVESTVDESKAL